MIEFKQYKTDTNSDGSINIRGLEIFKLCKRDNKVYDKKWFTKAKNYFEAEKVDEYFPPAFIGHETVEGKETENDGLLDNLELKGNTVYSDVIKVPVETFKKFKARKFPNRSVELHPKTGQILGLAFLGKTRPFHKLPIMEFRDEKDIETETVEFDESEFSAVIDVKDIKDDIQLESKITLLNDMWWKLKSIIGSIRNNPDVQNKKAEVKKAMTAGLDVIRSEVKKFEELEDMTAEEIKQLKADIKAELQTEFDEKFDSKYNERFKQDTGYESPVKFKESRAAEITAKFQEKKKSALEKMTAKGLVPALINEYIDPIIEAFAGDELETIKFCEGEKSGTIIELMEKFAESLVKRAENNTITVDYSERARFGEGDEDNPNFKESEMNVISTDREKLHKKILAFQEKHNIKTYEEAADKFMEVNK